MIIACWRRDLTSPSLMARIGKIETNKYDTAETVKQLKDHDLVYDKICGVASTNG
jgi:hypothetical protein